MATCYPKEAKNDLQEENVRGLDCKFFNGLLWCNYANIRLSFYVKWITTVLHTLFKMLICVYKNIDKIHKNWPPHEYQWFHSIWNEWFCECFYQCPSISLWYVSPFIPPLLSSWHHSMVEPFPQRSQAFWLKNWVVEWNLWELAWNWL